MDPAHDELTSSLVEATRRLTHPVTVLRTTVSGRDVSVVYEVDGETRNTVVLIDVERDERGSFDYAFYRGDDIEWAYEVEAIEAAALAAYDADTAEPTFRRSFMASEWVAVCAEVS